MGAQAVGAVGTLQSNEQLYDAQDRFARGPHVVRARDGARSGCESLVSSVHRHERERVRVTYISLHPYISARFYQFDVLLSYICTKFRAESI